MWIITHIPSGQNILGWNAKDTGFYSYKDAHKMLLTMNKLLYIGCKLYDIDFTANLPYKYVTIIHRLNSKKPFRVWNQRKISRRARIYKQARYFDTFYFSWEPYKPYLKGNKIITLLCERTSIRSKREQLKPINKSEFLIHYVN